MKMDLFGVLKALKEEIQADCSRGVRVYHETRAIGCVHFIDDEAGAAADLRRSSIGVDATEEEREVSAAASSARFSIASMCDQNDVSLARHTCSRVKAITAASISLVLNISTKGHAVREERMDGVGKKGL